MRYAEIRDEFHQRITSGDLKPGDRLPPEVVLCQRYKTSRATIAKALGELENQGLLRRRRGAGTFVTERKDDAKPVVRLAMFTPWVLQGEGIGYFQTHIHAGLSSLCAEQGVELALQGLSPSGQDYRAHLFSAADQLIKRKTSVVLFCPAELPHDQMHVNREVVDHLQSQGCPVILIDRDIALYPDRSLLPWVAYDNRRGAAQLAKHMIEQGYQRIAFVGIAQDSTAVADRQAGYADALRMAGRPLDPSLMFTVDQPDVAFCKHMLKTGKPDAVIAKDSLFAARIGSALLGERKRIGADVGLAGFDDNPALSVLPVPMTIVRQPVEPFVKAVYRMTQRVLEGIVVAGEQVVIPTELVVHRSTQRSR